MRYSFTFALIGVVLALVLTILFFHPQPHDTYTATVEEVYDGDTLKIGDKVIRLSIVNTPDEGHELHQKSADFTKSLCPVGSTATVDIDNKQPEGPYGRTIAVVYCNGTNLNEALLEHELARTEEEYVSQSEFNPGNW